MDGGGEKKEIGVKNAQRAEKWCKLFKSEFVHVMANLSAQSTTSKAAIIGKKIVAGKIKNGFNIRGFCRKGWQGISTKVLAEPILDILIERGYIAKNADGKFYINPLLAKSGE